MRSNPRGTQEGTGQKTVTLELPHSDLRQLHGLVTAEKNRCRRADEPEERRGAPHMAALEERLAMALRRA